MDGKTLFDQHFASQRNHYRYGENQYQCGCLNCKDTIIFKI